MAVMVSVMNLTGYVVVEHRDHAQHLIFPIIGAHVLGMYALVLVIGPVIDRVGHTRALAAGLIVMAVSCAGIQVFEGVWMTGVLLFGLRTGLERLVRRGHRAARRPVVRGRARQAPRLQRPLRLAPRRRPGAARWPRARLPRRDGARVRRRRDRPLASLLDLPAEGAGSRRASKCRRWRSRAGLRSDLDRQRSTGIERSSIVSRRGITEAKEEAWHFALLTP